MLFPLITKTLPSEQDILDLAANLRPADCAELQAVCDLTPLAAVRESLRWSAPGFVFAAHVRVTPDQERQLLGIGGAACSAADAVVGVPWLLATPLLDRYAKSLTREARAELRRMLRRWPLLSNLIDARQTAAIRWLAALGFEMREAEALKPGLPLLRFELRAVVYV
jgi:hypothetical protein